MFVYSVRASTLKFFAVIGVCLVLLITFATLGSGDTVYASVDGRTVNYGGMKTKEDRIEFIESFGLEVDPESETEEQFSMPDNFDRVLSGYNELQKSQGLDLSKYTKKKVTHYTYRVTNYDNEGPVYVNLLIYRSKIIACDISSGDPSGFVLPLSDIDAEKLK
ncbi:MAG: DUF4830 domain-containing protein [Clostridia bacterium]|nr:DUF4830 domain-containing protein [Clostridia bacterium]